MTYNYLLIPKLSERLKQSITEKCIIIIDEGHNIQKVCIENSIVEFKIDNLV